MRPRRLELPRPFGHSHLKAARLPIPPRPHVNCRRSPGGWQGCATSKAGRALQRLCARGRRWLPPHGEPAAIITGHRGAPTARAGRAGGADRAELDADAGDGRVGGRGGVGARGGDTGGEPIAHLRHRRHRARLAVRHPGRGVARRRCRRPAPHRPGPARRTCARGSAGRGTGSRQLARRAGAARPAGHRRRPDRLKQPRRPDQRDRLSVPAGADRRQLLP